jgi:uncharacterized ParB-like nuclease family protein
VPGVSGEKGDVKALVRALIDEARSTVRLAPIQQRLLSWLGLRNPNVSVLMLTLSGTSAHFAAGQHHELRACQRGHGTEGRQQLRHL